MERKAKMTLARIPTTREMGWKVVSGILLAVLLTSMFVIASSSRLVGLEQKTWTTDNRQTEDFKVLSNSNIDEWPMFHHDPGRTGYSTSKAPNTNNTIWSYTTGDDVYVSTVVADYKVYVGSDDGLPGTDDGEVYCLNALTGAFIWSYPIGDWIGSSPAVADGKVYVGSYDHKVYCLNALTGAFIWSYTTGQVVQSPPAVADGKVYVGSNDHKVYCLDAATGTHIWSYTTGGMVPEAPAVADGKVYVGSGDHKVYCLNALTGAFIWSYTTGYWVYSSPAVAYGKVYIGSYDGKVYAFGPRKYAILIAPVRNEDEDYYKQEIQRMRLVLLTNGWTDKNIIFLTRSDICKEATDEPWIDGDATYEDLGKALDAIASGGTYRFRQTNGTLGPEQTFKASGVDDIVFIELRDHGGQAYDGWRPTGVPSDPRPGDETTDDFDGVFHTYEWNDRRLNFANSWYDDEFDIKLDNIVCDKLILIVDACHSGEFIPDCSGSGRLICTSSAEDEGSQNWIYKFSERIVDPDADMWGDGNGVISVEEAHDYAVLSIEFYNVNQHPQKSDGIAGEVYLR